MKKLIMIALLTLSGATFAQDWATLAKSGDATYLGGYYAAVSYACLGTNYTDDSGVWASGPATVEYDKGCAKAVWDAIAADVATPH